MMDEMESSVLGRLLSELSWKGKGINRYRNGGLGYEDVLLTEVFQALEFLPREHFMGAIVDGLNMNNDELRKVLKKEIEESDFVLFPKGNYLRPSEGSHQTKIEVQPDGTLETKSTYTLIEAKRIKTSSFQEEQLSREFVILNREAGNKMPLLLLVLGKEPPVTIIGSGRMTIKEGILSKLDEVLDKSEGNLHNLSELSDLIDSSVAWITWDDIERIIREQSDSFDISSDSVKKSVDRLCKEILNSIERHR